jgi:putative flippase GtrA
MKGLLISFIDKFYFLVSRFVPLKTYRYAFCGGSNLAFDMCLYFIFYNFIFAKHNVDLYLVVLSPHIASLFFVFPITFTTGFMLNKYITFEDSNLRGRIQFFRYFVVGMGAILISYVAMKFFVDFMHFYPTPSRFITIMITVVYSYLLQSRFSFRVEQVVS